jgi:predicted nucleic acid-binding protein/DNA-binding XRE family transcriptional regulator
VKVVDTSVFIDAERHHLPAEGRIADLLRHGELAVSAVTVFELTCGRRSAPARLAFYEELFGQEAQVLPVTHLGAQLAAEVARLAGPAVGAPDALIAGTALEHGFPVVTSDTDFLRLPGLAVEWVPEPPLAHEPVAAYGARERRTGVGARIRALREAGGLRASEVAAAAGMARSNYARLESGRHEPGLRTLARAAAALRVPLSEVLA